MKSYLIHCFNLQSEKLHGILARTTIAMVNVFQVSRLSVCVLLRAFYVVGGRSHDLRNIFSVVSRWSTFSASLAFQKCVGGTSRVRHEYPAPVLKGH